METLTSLSHRQQSILRHLLCNSDGLTLDQLSGRLSISRNAVKQHLCVLEGLNAIGSHILPSGGGRPCRAYTLSHAGKDLFPKQYALFSIMLLKTLSKNLEDDKLESMLKSIGRELALPFKDRVRQSENIIAEVTAIMSELGYETVLPNSNDANEINAKNCVFHDLAKENPKVCELDLALISTLLESEIEQTECMAVGGHSCRFRAHK